MGGILVPKPMLGRQLNLGHRLSKGLVGYWLFNEGSGNKVFDLSGNGYNIAFDASGPNWTPAKFGFGLNFDLANTEYLLSDNPPVTAPPFTVSLWFYCNQLPSAVGSSFNLWSITDYDAVEIFILYISSDDKPTFRVYSGVGNNAVAPNVITAKTWYHVVIVARSTSDREIFINASERGTNTTNEVMTGISHMLFGATAWSSLIRNHADAIIDNLSIYNRTLSASERTELYLRPFAMFDREPLPLWTAATQGVEVTVGMAGAMTTNTGYWGW